MNKKAQMNIGTIVVLIMGIFVAIALGTQIFNQQAILTDKISVNNESIDYSTAYNSTGGINLTGNSEFTLTNAPTGWKITKCPLESFVLRNTSDIFTVDIDYTVDLTTGIVTFKNTTVVQAGGANITNATYVYCPDGYNVDAGSRGMARIIGLFTALALMAFVVAYALKEWV